MDGFVCYMIFPGLLFALYGIPRLLIEFFFNQLRHQTGEEVKCVYICKKRFYWRFSVNNRGIIFIGVSLCQIFLNTSIGGDRVIITV